MDKSLGGGRLALVLALVMTVALPAAALAQYGDGTSGTIGRPAHVHVGLCPVPGEIVGPLSDVMPSTGIRVGAPDAIGVELSSSVFDLTLSELVATDHVLAVHVAHHEMETLIACGDIGGPMLSATELVIGLAPVGGSGYTGVAVLTDVGAGMTRADVYLTRSAAMVASPDPDPDPKPGPYTR